MKKIYSLATALFLLSGTCALASSDVSSTAFGSSNTTFNASTNVTVMLSTDGTAGAYDGTVYTATSKQTTGGTTGYATTDSSTDIRELKNMDKDADPTDPGTAGDMPSGY